MLRWRAVTAGLACTCACGRAQLERRESSEGVQLLGLLQRAYSTVILLAKGLAVSECLLAKTCHARARTSCSECVRECPFQHIASMIPVLSRRRIDLSQQAYAISLDWILRQVPCSTQLYVHRVMHIWSPAYPYESHAIAWQTHSAQIYRPAQAIAGAHSLQLH